MSKNNSSSLSILILDDDEFIVKLLGHMVALLGYHNVSLETSGVDVITNFSLVDRLPDIILLDINMPVMDGVEFVRHLAELEYKGELILISGEDDLMFRAANRLCEAYKLSVQASLHKPIALAHLADALNVCAAKNRSGNVSTFKKKLYGPDELKAAIAEDKLLIYYQPKVSLVNGEILGAEALVRWQHATDGLVFPDQFIPVAEAYSLIDQLTQTVIKKALLQIKIWQNAGMNLKVSINLSMDNLGDVSIADSIINEAFILGVCPSNIILEITESRLMKNFTVALDVLTRLRLKRFRLSIDDFGTGHSSLVQLRDFPFDELKIDRSFVHGASYDVRLKAIFEASLDLANHLEMDVVAEGVENIDDWRFLRHSGCKMAQGYFIGRPMPDGLFMDWMKTWESRVVEENLLK